MPSLTLPNWGFRRARAVVGIDLGESVLKAVEVQRAAAGGEVVRAVTEAVPPGLRGGDPAPLGEWLGATLRRRGIRAKNAVMTVPGRHVVLRWLQLPAGTPAEIAQMVRFQAGKDLPLPIEQVRFNFMTQGEAAAPAPAPAAGDAAPAGAKIGVLLAAVPAEAADRLDAVADAAGLALEGATPATVATWAAAVAAGAGAGVTAVIDAGWGSTEIMVGRDGRLRFSRSGSVGLSGLAAALGRRGEAEGKPLETAKASAELPPAAADWTRKWLAEIGRSLRAQQAEPGGAAVERIVLAGGGAAVPGLAKALAADAGVPVVPLDLFAGPALKASGAETAAACDPSFSAAAGAALGALREDAPGLNLLGALVVRRRLVLGRMQRAGIAAGIIGLLALGIGRLALAGKEGELAAREAELARLKPRVDQVLKLEQKIELASAWGTARLPLADLLLQLTQLRPAEVYLTTVTLEESGTLRIGGRSQSNQAVSRFVSGLNGSTFFGGAELGPVVRNTEKSDYKYDFTLTAQAKPATGRNDQ